MFSWVNSLITDFKWLWKDPLDQPLNVLLKSIVDLHIYKRAVTDKGSPVFQESFCFKGYSLAKVKSSLRPYYWRRFQELYVSFEGTPGRINPALSGALLVFYLRTAFNSPVRTHVLADGSIEARITLNGIRYSFTCECMDRNK